MASSNVFGTPITNATLKQMAEYENEVVLTRRDRAAVALWTKESEGKYADARAYLETLKKARGYSKNHIFCLIYNATGDSVTIDSDGSDGGILESPYPLIIANGQLGAFSKSSNHQYSPSAVVYAAYDAHGIPSCQFLFLFKAGDQGGRCHTEIQVPNYYPRASVEQTVENQYGESLNCATNASHSHKLGFSSFASVGGSINFANFEGIMTFTQALSFDPTTEKNEETASPE